MFQATVSEIEDFPAARLRRLVMSLPPEAAAPDYHAGQYAMLTFNDQAPRPYSIGNAPGGTSLEFHIRRSGSGTSVYATTELRVGDSVGIALPFGDCLYVRDCSRPLIAVAGGSGLAAMKAIIEEALADPARTGQVYLYCGAKTQADLYLDDMFRTLEETDSRFQYIPVLSEENGTAFRHGLVTAAVMSDFPDLSHSRIYGAGPVEMLRHLTETALAHHADPAHIHTDLHHARQETAATADTEPDIAR